jgi:hypothetical protein
MAGPMVLRWAWRNHVLEVEECDSVKEAVTSSYYAEASGDEGRGWIEVGDSESWRIVSNAEREAIEAPLREGDDRPWEAPDGPWFRVQVRTPSFPAGFMQFDTHKWVAVTGSEDVAKAESDRARLAALLGAERVRVERVR